MTPRALEQLRVERARRCQGMRDGERCRLPWRVTVTWQAAGACGPVELKLCHVHARAKSVNVWTEERERRELKALRQIQLDTQRLVGGRR